MRAPRWIPLQKLLDLDEEFQNEIPASPQPCQVPLPAYLCEVWWQIQAPSLASTFTRLFLLHELKILSALVLRTQLRNYFYWIIWWLFFLLFNKSKKKMSEDNSRCHTQFDIFMLSVHNTKSLKKILCIFFMLFYAIFHAIFPLSPVFQLHGASSIVTSPLLHFMLSPCHHVSIVLVSSVTTATCW